MPCTPGSATALAAATQVMSTAVAVVAKKAVTIVASVVAAIVASVVAVADTDCRDAAVGVLFDGDRRGRR